MCPHRGSVRIAFASLPGVQEHAHGQQILGGLDALAKDALELGAESAWVEQIEVAADLGTHMPARHAIGTTSR